VELGLVARAADLAGAELLVGWESAVVRSGDGWIYRFGRKDDASFRRELAVLELVDGRLGVPTPRIEAVDHPQRLMVYRTITGAELDEPRVLRQTPSERSALVASMAEVLASMHALGGAASALEVPVLDPTPLAAEALAARSTLSRRDQRSLDELLAAWHRTTLASRTAHPVLQHGDFHVGNMVFAGPTGPIAGIWDFSCVQVGDPAADLRYMAGQAPTLGDEIGAAYSTLTGRPLDLEAARLMLVLEDITDAMAEQRSCADVLEQWRRTARS
jgi:aminoglycoside phosphotransferase (APT) family kinase protein